MLPEVQTLYDACISEQKGLHILTSYEHSTDLLSDEDKYSRGAYGGSNEEQKQERRQLADDLMRFVNDAFGVNVVGIADNEDSILSPMLTPDNSETVAPTQSAETNRAAQSGNGNSVIIWVVIGTIIVFIRGKKR